MAADVDVLMWNTLTSGLNPHSEQKLGEEQVKNILESAQPWLLLRIHEWFLELLQNDLRKIRLKFWSHFPSLSSGTDLENSEFWQSLLDAVEELFNQLVIYKPAVDILKFLTALSPVRDVSQQFQDTCKAVLFSKIPDSFKKRIESFYRRAFKSFFKVNSKAREKLTVIEGDSDGNNSKLDDSCTCEVCEEEDGGCSCEEFLSQFALLNEQLRSLGLLHKVAGEAFVSVIHIEIKNHINKTCQGEFESSFLGSLLQWLNNELCGWLQIVIDKQGNESYHGENESLLKTWKPKLLYFLYKSFAELRIEELFNMIVEFPDSLPALNDLKECLEKTDLRSQLIKSLRSAFETRLLHPGANTSDILTQYISAIRALRVLDPTGVILENVCDPVKQYLRTREDTVRCIVTSLTDENSTELSEELIHGNPLPIDEMDASDSEDEGEEWMPDPVDADPTKTTRSRRTPDIISMLVSIYGSKDLFVAEYRTLLADRILSVFNYDVDRELRYLELLKLRFGESHLHFCEVMLKDVADSRRINAHIHSSKNEVLSETNIDMNAMILSAVFWPSFKEEKLKVSDEINQAMSDYTKGYEALKGMRTLQWKPHLGLVELDIELEDRTLSLSVTPVQATAIMHFQEKERWTLEELSSTMHVPQGLLRKRLAFWVNNGVLKEDTADNYVVIERQKGTKGGVQDVALDTEEESLMASSEDQREEELQVFWSYIIGMLTNLESLPLERIHSMLRMFAMQGPLSNQCSLEDVRRFLDRKVKDQELQLVNGLYRLPKPSR